MADKLRVGVVFGGRSGEHEVSLMSAASILSALDPNKYEVVPIGITSEGRWLLLEDAAAALERGVEGQGGRHVAVIGDPSEASLLDLEALTDKPLMQSLDVVFPVLHGTFGEDGTIQGLLELADIPYVGAGVLGSAAGMDKGIMKNLFVAADIPTPAFRVFLRSRLENRASKLIDAVEEGFSYPVFTKPANLGSSVGITKVRGKKELREALELAAEYDRRIIVEQGIEPARELECSVLGNELPEVSVVGEIVPANEFYDYEAKYISEDSELIIPAEISSEVEDRVREYAVRAFRAIDCAGMARVDFLLRPTDGKLFVNEINTIPGFTKISMYPKLWEASGLSYPALVDRLIELALERYKDRRSSRTTYG